MARRPADHAHESRQCRSGGGAKRPERVRLVTLPPPSKPLAPAIRSRQGAGRLPFPALGALLATLAGPLALNGQASPADDQPPEPNPGALSYEREWFRYQHDGRRDPFLPTPELGNPLEGVSAPSPPARLLGIIHHPERSDLGIALLAGPEATTRPGGMAAIRLRIGQSRAGVRLARILADRVVIEADGSGGTLRHAIHLPERSRERRPR